VTASYGVTSYGTLYCVPLTVFLCTGHLLYSGVGRILRYSRTVVGLLRLRLYELVLYGTIIGVREQQGLCGVHTAPLSLARSRGAGQLPRKP
jgi:hypothetical protein